MSAMVLSGSSMKLPSFAAIDIDKPLALGLTIGFHVLLGSLLLLNWKTPQPQVPQPDSIKVAMIAMASPIAPPVSTPRSEPKVSAPVPQMPEPAAELARKRVEKKETVPREVVPRQNVTDHTQQKQSEELQRETAQRESDRQAEEQRQRDAADAARQEAANAARLAASRQYLPIEKQAPAYPQRALEKGIEGACTVSYTVNVAGRVENPQIAGECNPAFIRPSLEAAKGFRYEPRIVDGKAVAVPNVKNTFQYRIEQHAASATH